MIQFEGLGASADTQIWCDRQVQVEVVDGIQKAAILLLVTAAAQRDGRFYAAYVIIGVVAVKFETEAIAQSIADTGKTSAAVSNV